MKRCPFCAEEIRDEAVKCRYCGEFLDGRPATAASPQWGYEYRSEAELLGLPLVHVAHGVHPETGRPRVARGILAIGNIAIGVVAVGGLALGGLTLGGLSLGLLALGGMAAGGVAAGGLALGAHLAIGGIAVAGKWAIGGLALAPHTASAAGVDPEIARWLERLPGG